MQSISYESIFKKEKNYWWYAARREIISCLRKIYETTPSPVALNIGCGTGELSLDLENQVHIINLDFNRDALLFCRQKNLRKLLQADGSRLPVQNNRMDEVYALDFLEHLENDREGLREIYRCLKPVSGRAIITVPAFSFLWSKMDHLAHHRRRYRLKEFKKLLLEAGFKIHLLSYYNFFLFPLGFVFKILEKKSKRTDEEAFIPSVPGGINILLKKIFSSERFFLPKVKFPFGVSIIAVIEK